MAENNDKEFAESSSTEKMKSNVLERARYRGKVLSIAPHTSDKGKKSDEVWLLVEGRKIRDYLPAEGVMVWKRNNFYYSIGIREKSKFIPNPKIIVGKECMVDVKVKPAYYDENDSENYISGYSPIKEETAPIKGVEPEVETKSEKKSEPKPEKKPEPKDDIDIL